MKKFWVLVTVLLMVFSITTVSLADGDFTTEGDVYYYNKPDDDWPDMHWVFMSDSEVAKYENNGWYRSSGVLWYRQGVADQTMDLFNVSVEEISSLYNDGWHLNILYNWVCDKDVYSKNTEQSVSVGFWELNEEQAEEYYSTFSFPVIKISGLKASKNCYRSNWYFGGQVSADPVNVSEEDKLKYAFVREIYKQYDFGYGSYLYLNSDEPDECYSYDRAFSEGEFFDELFHN